MESGIIGVLGTVLGVLLGGPITYHYAKILVKVTHKNSIDIIQRQEFNRAATQFRGAFWPEIEFLDKQFLVDRASVNVSKKSCDILFEAASRHQEAIYLFSFYLSSTDRERLKKAWQDYCKGGSDVKYFREEYPCKNEFQQIKSEAKALDRIKQILEVAKFK